LLFARETWKTTVKVQKKLDVFRQRNLSKDHWSYMERQGNQCRSIDME